MHTVMIHRETLRTRPSDSRGKHWCWVLADSRVYDGDLAILPVPIRVNSGWYAVVTADTGNSGGEVWDDCAGTFLRVADGHAPEAATAERRWLDLSDGCRSAWLRLRDLAVATFANYGVMVPATSTFADIRDALRGISDPSARADAYMDFDSIYVNGLALYHYGDAVAARADAGLLLPWLMEGGDLQ